MNICLYGASSPEIDPVYLDAAYAFGRLGLAPTWTAEEASVVVQIRLPRILSAALIGAALSAAGTSYQAMFRNPMVSPDLLGASTGACFGAALAILLGASYAVITAST